MTEGKLEDDWVDDPCDDCSHWAGFMQGPAVRPLPERSQTVEHGGNIYGEKWD